MKSEKKLTEYFNRAATPPAGWQGSMYFKNDRGQKNRYAKAPALGNKKGTIVLTHGYGESIDLYYETIKKFQKRGYEVWAMDWIGMGRSDRDYPDKPLTISSESMLRHVDDLDHFVKKIVKHDKSKPMIMSAHSLGGHMGMIYLKKYPDVFDGAIMSAPMFDMYRLGLPKIFRPAIKLLFNVAAAIGLKDVPVPGGDKIEREISEQSRTITELNNSPLTLREEWRRIIGKNEQINRPTFGWIASAFKTADMILDKDFIKSIKTPILIGSAEFENLVNNKAHDHVAKLMGDKATLVKMENARHNLWHGTQKNHTKWWQHVSDFINLRQSEFISNKADNRPIIGNDNKPPIINNDDKTIPKIKHG